MKLWKLKMIKTPFVDSIDRLVVAHDHLDITRLTDQYGVYKALGWENLFKINLIPSDDANIWRRCLFNTKLNNRVFQVGETLTFTRSLIVYPFMEINANASTHDTSVIISMIWGDFVIYLYMAFGTASTSAYPDYNSIVFGSPTTGFVTLYPTAPSASIYPPTGVQITFKLYVAFDGSDYKATCSCQIGNTVYSQRATDSIILIEDPDTDYYPDLSTSYYVGKNYTDDVAHSKAVQVLWGVE